MKQLGKFKKNQTIQHTHTRTSEQLLNFVAAYSSN